MTKPGVRLSVLASALANNGQFRALFRSFAWHNACPECPFRAFTPRMTKTISQSPLEAQAEAVEAVAAEIQRTARQELDALRDLVGTRLASLERTLDRNRHDPALAPILERLCKAAAEQAERASAAARAEAEEAAARDLAAAREQAQTDLKAA